MTKEYSKVYSMTGYGQAEKHLDDLAISIEIKSVNSRYLDLNIKYPNEYGFLEIELRNLLKQKLQRGRIDVFIRRTSNQKNGAPKINVDLFQNYWNIIQEVFKNVNIDQGLIDPTQLSTFILNQNEIISTNSSQNLFTGEKELIYDALNEALLKLLNSREIEGKALIQIVSKHVDAISEILSKIQEKKGSVLSALSKDLLAKLTSLFQQLDFTSERLEQEAAWRIERSDISEELNRISVHLASLNSELTQNPSGKKIEFLSQELGREFNTISAKVPSAEIQTLVVNAKLEIEKIREQSFNIE